MCILFQIAWIVAKYSHVRNTSLVHAAVYDTLFEPWLATQFMVDLKHRKAQHDATNAKANSDLLDAYEKDENLLIVSLLPSSIFISSLQG